MNWSDFLKGFGTGVIAIAFGILVLIGLAILAMPGNVDSTQRDQQLREARDAAKARVDRLRELRDRAENAVDSSLDAEMDALLGQ